MKKIKVVIADDNRQFAKELMRELEADPRFELAGTAENGDEACSLILQRRPDVVILDIILSKKDGLIVMDTVLKAYGSMEPPAFLVVSAVNTDAILQEAFAHGADYFLQKPVAPSLVVSRLPSLARHQVEKEHHLPSGFREDSSTYICGNPDTDITGALHALGIPVHLKGYQYLRDGITLTLKNPARLHHVTSGIYQVIARKRKSTPDRVERAIRHAIDVSWTKGRMPLLDRLYGYGTAIREEKPTNSEFMAIISDKLSMEYKKALSKK